jgi:hypothetical protein
VSGRWVALLAGALASLALAAPAMGGGIVSSTTRWAAPNGTASGNPCTNFSDPCDLQYAIGTADPGDHISVAPGDYDGGADGFYVNRQLIIEGQSGSTRPRLFASNSISVLVSATGVTLNYLEIDSTKDLALLMLHPYTSGTDAGDAGTVEDVVVHASHNACVVQDLVVTFRDSICTSSNGDYALLGESAKRFAALTLRNVTAIAQAPGAGAVEMSYSGNCGGCDARLTMVNTIARGGAYDVLAAAQSGGGGTVATLSYSNFDPAKATRSGPGNISIADEGHNQSALPVFTGGCTQDFHEAIGSPTIDAGVDGAADGPFDFERDPRTVGSHTDVGADEFQPPGSGDACPAGTGVPTGAGPTGGEPPIDLVAPVLGSTSVTNSVFAVNAKGAAETLVAARRGARKGTAFRYTLSEPARVVFTIQRASRGRKVRSRCRKPVRSNRTRRKCTRYAAAGRFAQQSPAGKSLKRWSGKIGKKKLKPGRYRATLVAIDIMGTRSAPKRLKFRVVRR